MKKLGVILLMCVCLLFVTCFASVVAKAEVLGGNSTTSDSGTVTTSSGTGTAPYWEDDPNNP